MFFFLEAINCGTSNWRVTNQTINVQIQGLFTTATAVNIYDSSPVDGIPSNVDSVSVTDRTETALTLQWNTVNNNNEYNYNLTFNSGPEISITASEGSDIVTYTVSSLSPGTKYTFTLYTVFEGVRSSGFSNSTVTIPSNVDSVSVTDHTETALTLQWNTVNNNNEYSYNLTFNSGPEISITASEGSDIVTFTVSSLSPGTKYTFTLYTVFEGVRSSGHNICTVTSKCHDNVLHSTVFDISE
ncbi:fibronectin-like [Chanos chanos]|uniref:Fibronectin-like n=1 Tax=Chanos chanos TaxID=29144 RepID=A0A6J2UR49_CHACN|nr:fibronectin-like [Chanos chanos]